MSYIIPDKGLDWVADRAYGISDSDLYQIAAGIGDSFPESTDEALDNRVYIGNETYDTVSFDRSSNTGQINCTITLAGGTHVDPNTQVTELGVFTDDGTMVYREVRDPITIDDGERVTIKFSLEFGR